MHPKLNWIDWVIAAGYLAVVVGIGVRFLRRQESAVGFFLANRSLGWVPVGFSLTATSISTITFVSMPAAGIRHDWACLWWLAPFLVVLPFAWAKGLPWLRADGPATVYERLEWSFGPEVRFACSVLFLIWRLLWTATIIYTAGRTILLIVGGPFPEWSTILLLSLVTTLYTYLGGMRAVVWTDVVQTLVMFAGVGCVLWLILDGTRPSLDLAAGADVGSAGAIPWNQLAISIFDSSVALLSLYLGDQITAQRFLAARSLKDSRLGLVLHTFLTLTLLGGLGAAGVLLSASGEEKPAIQVPQAGALEDERGRVPGPAAEVTQPSEFHGLEQRSVQISGPERVLPIFISDCLVPGISAVIGLALVAAAMSTFDSAVNSLGAVLHFDLERRFRWGTNWHEGNAVEPSLVGGELKFAKPLTWLLGVAAGLLSLALPSFERSGVFPVISALNGTTAPMLGLILVAMLGVSSTAAMAGLGLAFGLLTTYGLLILRDLRPELVESNIWLDNLSQAPFICGAIISAALTLLGREKRSSLSR